MDITDDPLATFVEKVLAVKWKGRLIDLTFREVDAFRRSSIFPLLVDEAYKDYPTEPRDLNPSGASSMIDLPTSGPVLIEIEEACKRLRLTMPLMYKLIRNRTLKAIQRGRHIYIEQTDLQAYVDALPLASGK